MSIKSGVNYLIGLFCFLMVLGCYNLERNCKDYKTGTFRFDYEINGEKKSGTFIRTEDYSVDYFDTTIDSSSVRWINDCEFILKKINPQNRSEEDAIHMKILTTTDTSYTFEYKLAIKKRNRPTQTQQGVAIKIDQ